MNRFNLIPQLLKTGASYFSQSRTLTQEQKSNEFAQKRKGKREGKIPGIVMVIPVVA